MDFEQILNIMALVFVIIRHHDQKRLMEESIHFDLCSRVEVHNGKEGIAADGWNRKLRNPDLLQGKMRELRLCGVRLQTLHLAPSDILLPSGHTCEGSITFPSFITRLSNT